MFDIPYYKMLEKYLQVVGQDPRQRDIFRSIIVTIMVTSITGILVPTSLEVYRSLYDKDMDGVIECMPHLIAAITSIVKILNVHFNRENFRKLFEFVRKQWEELKLTNDLRVLEEVTIQGSKMAQLYRSRLSCLNFSITVLLCRSIIIISDTLLIFMVLFLLVPLLFPILDVVLPLNETRPRQQLFRVNYIFFDHEEYFFYIYLQLAWGSVIVVMIIVTVDSLYILIIHHSSGLFAVCGHQVHKATSSSIIFSTEAMTETYTYEQIKNCVITHDKAIEFYNILNENSRSSYLLQVGLNMMGISMTAVQTVANLERPAEAVRTGIFLGAEQFHLFVISLPGQVLLDHCSDLANNIYGSTWYKIPVKIQKMLLMMQIRSKKLCTLTAGGLYEMNMENFAIVCNIMGQL
ncbi:uncharacterized protein LOC105665636 [Bombus terrestris]|uniref:Odorant receptor n=1 Tax=Bombus terrestris TaxID=30195 RepID=A0A9C6WBC1_BOMTE|nr:uncharacterized protein LOC105665636 [Bombus terrestris]